MRLGVAIPGFVLLAACAIAVAHEAEDSGLEREKRERVVAHLAKEEFAEALAIYDARIQQGDAPAGTYHGAAICLMRMGRYADATTQSREGRKRLKTLEEQTEASRTLRKKFTELESDIKRLKKIRDVHIPKMVGELIKDVPRETPFFKSRYIEKEGDYDPESDSVRRRLRPEYRSGHCTLITGSRWGPDVLSLIESYPDRETAEARIAAMRKAVKQQRKRYERGFRYWHKVKKVDLVERAEPEEARLEKNAMLLRKITFGWETAAKPFSDDRSVVTIKLQQIFDTEKATEPKPGTWYSVGLILEPHWFGIQK